MNIHLFDILCASVGIHIVISSESILQLFWLITELVTFFFSHGTTFYLKELLTNYDLSWFFRLRCLLDIFFFFSKMNQVSLLCQEKQLIVFVVRDTCKAFRQNLKFGKFVFAAGNMAASPNVKTFLMRPVVIANVNFWYCIMKCVNTWKISLTQWMHIFWITSIECSKSCTGKTSIQSRR